MEKKASCKIFSSLQATSIIISLQFLGSVNSVAKGVKRVIFHLNNMKGQDDPYPLIFLMSLQ